MLGTGAGTGATGSVTGAGTGATGTGTGTGAIGTGVGSGTGTGVGTTGGGAGGLCGGIASTQSCGTPDPTTKHAWHMPGIDVLEHSEQYDVYAVGASERQSKHVSGEG